MTLTLKGLLLGFCLLGSLGGCVGAVVGGAALGITSMAHDRRTAGTILEDQNITVKIRGEFNKLLPRDSHVNITSYNNVVLLSGEVPTLALSQRAAEIAASIEKVKHVHNELIVAPPTSLNSRSTDLLISTKVKTALFKVDGFADFDPTRVKVVSERGTVYLLGLLQPDEAAAVTAVVRRVNGVQKVVMLFEYTQ